MGTAVCLTAFYSSQFCLEVLLLPGPKIRLWVDCWCSVVSSLFNHFVPVILAALVVAMAGATVVGNRPMTNGCLQLTVVFLP